MVFARSRKGCSEERKRIGNMSGEPSSASGSVFEFSLSNERDGEVVDLCHDFAGITDRHDHGIFTEGDIAAAMQSILDAPMGTTNFQDA